MKKLSYILLVTIVCIIGLLNWYDTPTMSDDVLYHFVWQNSLDHCKETFQQIENINDVVNSQINHYQYVNGRTVSQGLAQIILNLIPISISKLLNTAFFILLIGFVTLYTAKTKENRLFVAATSFGMTFLMMKGFETGFIWLLGAITYLWMLSMTMAFLLMIRWLNQRSMSWKLLPLVLLSFIIGWSHEAIAIPLSVAMVVYLTINRKNILSKAITYCMIAYIMGMLMILISPSLWNRADIEGIPLMSRIINGCVNILFGIRISWLLVLTIITLFIKRRKDFINTVKEQRYLLIAWIVAIGIVFFCGTTIDRVSICADFIALLIVLNIWQRATILRYKKVVISFIIISSIVIAIPAIYFNYLNNQNYQYHDSQLKDHYCQLIKVHQIPVQQNTWMKQLVKRYVNPTIEFNFYNCYMAFDKKDINSKAIAKLYNRKNAIFLPEDVINRIENDSTAYSYYESDEHDNLYIMKLYDRQDVHNVTFLLGDEVPLMFYQRILSFPDDEYELDSFNYEVLDINNKEYLVMTIPTTNIKRRIKDIKIN